MKKPVTILLLLIFFTAQLGYHAVYLIQQQHIKESVKKKLLSAIPESALSVFVAEDNKGFINWEEEGKEFRAGGQLYDVVKIKKESGKTFIYCLADTKEHDLIEKYSREAGNDQNGVKGKKTVKFPSFDCTDPGSKETDILYTFHSIVNAAYQNQLTSLCKKVNAPPPRS